MTHHRIALVVAALLCLPAGGAHADLVAPSAEVFVGIRPGALMVAPWICTMDFVFQESGSTFDPAQQLYIGTAGHCVDFVGEHVSLKVNSPVDGSSVTVDIGTVSVIGGLAVSNDFALVAIKPELNSWVSPTVAHWGGPTAADLTSGPGTPVTYTGHGKDVRDGVGAPAIPPGYPRAGVLGARQDGYIKWLGPTLGGDSGGPVTTATGLALAETKGPNIGADGLAWGVDIQSMLSIGGKALSTCESAKPWPLPGCPTV